MIGKVKIIVLRPASKAMASNLRQCRKGHRYRASPANRDADRGCFRCPKCAALREEIRKLKGDISAAVIGRRKP